ncbi:MAG: ABC transporter ATP-binding protein/permease [Bacteroidetes bacterium]|nr:ABC transporter ATP-binding protein/permease [Bacteroidota bacterium]
MQIPKGKITALYGPNGSGKSTIVQILQRKYMLSGGCLLLDNVDACTLNLELYRKLVAVVPQNIKIFNGSILDNILIGRELSSLDEMDSKIAELGFSDFFKRFEQSYFTLLGEDGRHLSGGEKQVIALIRAMFDKPGVLIIDEGLSGLDPELETLIFDRLIAYANNNSVFIITHDIRSLEKCAQIYRFENGEVKLSDNKITLRVL